MSHKTACLIPLCFHNVHNSRHSQNEYTSCKGTNEFCSFAELKFEDCSSTVLTLRLSGWMADLKVKRLCVGSLDHGDIASCPLVCLSQRVGPPVRPVNLSAVHSDGEGMWQILMPPQNLNQSRTIILGWVNSIRPVYNTIISMKAWLGMKGTVCASIRCLHECVCVHVCALVFFFLFTGHQSRGCGALDNPQWVRLASLHCQFPYGWSSCLLHSWMQLQSWANWHPSLSRRGSCSSIMQQHGHAFIKTLSHQPCDY